MDERRDLRDAGSGYLVTHPYEGVPSTDLGSDDRSTSACYDNARDRAPPIGGTMWKPRRPDDGDELALLVGAFYGLLFGVLFLVHVLQPEDRETPVPFAQQQQRSN